MSFQGIYLGYGKLEKMLANSGHNRVYASLIFENSPAPNGMKHRLTLIQVASIADDGIVHYWRWKIAATLMLASGQPFDDLQDARSQSATESAWPAVMEWLQARTQVVEAALAMPLDLKYLDGERPAFLCYEATTACFMPREVNHA